MQGFVSQKTFTAPKPENHTSGVNSSPEHQGTTVKAADFAEDPVPVPDPTLEQSYILTLISRRTIHRAGLRYLRRGVDDAGHAANGVETEQLLSTPSWDHIWSYVQIRASIPLYFSQSPYSFKPRPVLHQSEEANAAAFRAHFKQIRDTYGSCHCVSLVEQHGPEAIVGDKYRDYLSNLNSSLPSNVSKIGWTWFDFHRECRGMRFENVSRLFEEIGSVLDTFSYTTEDSSRGVTQRQSGVLRTNCMDCLDRTNVVQAGSARRALDSQLSTLGITLDDTKTSWFNIMWADNGDAISKQYASTAALKGDFTRTRKRNLQGALTDFGLTINRYFNNIISDFFTQAAIDFLLGNVSAQVFIDFEAEMTSSDPAVSMRRVRQNAIEISSKIVVEDETEELHGGWTLLAPSDPSRRGPPMTEVVLLLTDRALYRCDFDWALEKVSAFERVLVEDVGSIQWGAYITSTLASSHVDENRNSGFVVRYRSEKREVIRVNTRSLQTSFSKDEQRGKRGGEWVFKAMPAAHAVMKEGEGEGGKVGKMGEASEKEAVRRVVGEIGNVCGEGVKVEEGEVVSLQEAKKGTGLLEQWGYSLKRLVWA